MIAKRAKSTYFDELLIGLSPQVKENFGLCVLGATKITFQTSTGEPESRRGGSHCPPVACCAASILHRLARAVHCLKISLCRSTQSSSGKMILPSQAI